MKILLLGSNGPVGRRILAEAITRGHEVTVFARPESRAAWTVKPTHIVTGNFDDSESVARATEGQDAVISALGLQPDGRDAFIKLYETVITGLDKADMKRFVVVGGAGSLEVTPGIRLFDTPEFPAFILPIARAHGEVLELLKKSDLDWTYVSPAALFLLGDEPGERRGIYRRGTTKLLIGENGKSEISGEDYAIGLLDEVENPLGIRRQITLAW